MLMSCAAPEQIVIVLPQSPLSRAAGGASPQNLAGSGRRLLAIHTTDVNLSVIPNANQVQSTLGQLILLLAPSIKQIPDICSAESR